MSDFNLGTVTAYGYAKDKGYTGTEEEFAELMASYASVAESAAASAESAAASATTATTKAGEASTSASNAATSATTASNAATTATTKAGEASTSASTASTKASEATTAAATATTKAGEASTSATNAAGSATTASTAATTATTKASEAAASATRAQEILDSIPEDYSQLSEDVSDLKDGLNYDVDSICEYIEHDINELVGGWQSGFWANGTGAYNPTRTDYVCSVNGVKVVPAQTIYVKNIPYAGTVYLVPYKKDGSYNTGSNNVSQVISNHAVSFTVPSNTYYIKFDIISGNSGPNPMIPADYVDTVVSYTNYQDFSTINNYVISRDFIKHPLNVTYKGHIKQMQAFCIYDEKYYSTDGSNISIQNADLTDVSTTSISTGHGNSFQIGSGSTAYISGWNDNKVYAVDLDNMTISDTITLPTTGYTTCAIDDVNKIAYIFQRDSVPDTEAYYNFIVYDYDNEQVLSTKKTTIKMAAMQDLDFVDGTIIVSYGLGTSVAPSGIVAFDTNGDVAFRYDIPLFAFELEGVAYNRQENRLEASNVSTSLYWITQK